MRGARIVAKSKPAAKGEVCGNATGISVTRKRCNQFIRLVKLIQRIGHLDVSATGSSVFVEGFEALRSLRKAFCQVGWMRCSATCCCGACSASRCGGVLMHCVKIARFTEREVESLLSMPALHAKTPRLVVAHARHSPRYGCAMRLDPDCFDAPFGHGENFQPLSARKTQAKNFLPPSAPGMRYSGASYPRTLSHHPIRECLHQWRLRPRLWVDKVIRVRAYQHRV